MKHFSINIFLLGLMTLCGMAYGQNKVSGTVRDSHGAGALEGVVVNLVGSDGVSAFTDAEGFYELPVSSKNEVAVEFSFADYYSKRVYIHGRSTVNASLSHIGQGQDDLAVRTPNGTRLRSDISGSSVTITRDQILRRGYLTLESALQGMVPGMLVTSRSGISGGGSTMNLRGAASASGNTQPLVVVDGVIYETALGELSGVPGNFYNPLTAIKPRDIDQITVVKDGMSALYGTLGSNGVIYVYTTDSDVKKTRVDFNLDFGVSLAPERTPVMDAASYKAYALEQTIDRGLTYSQIEEQYPYLIGRAEDAEAFRYGNDTDWQDEIYQTGIMNRYSANVQGGDEVTTYNFSVGYTQNDDVIKNTDFESFDILMNAKMRLLGSLVLRPKVSLTKINANTRAQGSDGTQNPVLASLYKSPMMGVYKRSDKGLELPFYDDFGVFGMSNPAALIAEGKGSNENFRLRAGIQADQKIGKNLQASVMVMSDLFTMKESSFIPLGSQPQLEGAAKSLMQNNQKNFFSLLSDLNINYKKTFAERHRLNVVAGTRLKVSEMEDELATDVNSPSNKFTVIGRGDKSFRKLDPKNGTWNMFTVYGNASYAYLDKYYLDLGLTVDGSSKFGEGNRFGYFPYASGAWRVSSERFMSGLGMVNNLKLRASYGVTGNDDIGYYASRFSYVGLPYFSLSGIVRGGVPSTDLKWEETSQANIGLDLALLDNRIKLTADFYQNKTDDLLTTEPLDIYYGLGLLVKNGGSLENTGFELGLGYEFYRSKDLTAEIGFTFAKNSNEVTGLGSNALYSDSKGYHQISQIDGGEIINQVGQPAGEFYGYRSMGVISTTQEAEKLNLKDRHGKPFRAGDIAFQDLNGDNIIDESDRTAIGNAMPDFFGSVYTNIRYKRFGLGLMFDYASGNDVYNHMRRGLESTGGYYNRSEAVNRRWRGEGQQTDIPKVSYGDPMGNARFSDRWIEDGSFIRLKNVTASYDFNVKTKTVRSLSAYVAANNLFTLTDYLGATPDIAYGNSVMTHGVDYGQIPLLKSVMLGVKLGI
ncbi:SusC/RagA family TonB-linked outer membrane protein [Fulvitalea axinellae]|uniref:SusC/RagA family TonB-linked outer membrane protein n=1 Tax=Fulvitalea axinellae TaxID=1182444 RepID=A0AAU9CZG6_9BACT|nr:SusC/RagA family TonB-linked outer membrane protein [Fulvitalea axinellae]